VVPATLSCLRAYARIKIDVPAADLIRRRAECFLDPNHRVARPCRRVPLRKHSALRFSRTRLALW